MAEDTNTDGIATVASGASLVFAGRVVKLVVALAVQVVLARVLGAPDYGAVVLAQMVLGIGGIVAMAGLDDGVLRKLPYHEDTPSAARGVVRDAVGIATVMSLLVAAGVFATAPFFATRVFSDPSTEVLIRLAAVALPFSILGRLGVAISRASRDAKTHVVVRQILDPISQFVLVGGLVVAGYGAVGALVGVVASQVLAFVVSGWLALHSLQVPIRGDTRRMARPLLAFSLPLLFAGSMEFVIVHTDTFLIGTFRASSDVGIYNVAYQIRQVGLLFFYPITFLLPPVLTRLTSSDDRQQAHRTYTVASKWLVLATTPIVLVMFTFPETAIAIPFGVQYTGGATALRLLLIPVVVTVLLSANDSALIALGHSRIHLYGNSSAVVMNLVLNLALIPPFGIVGAAAASAATFVFRNLVYSTALYRWEDFQPFSVAMLRPFLGVLLVWTGGYLLAASTWTLSLDGTVAFCLLFLLAYPFLLVAFGAVEPEDTEVLSQFERRFDVDLSLVHSTIERLQ